MTSEWTLSGGTPHGAGRDGRIAPVPRDRDHGYDRAVWIAYREVVPDIPDDLLRLLAKLN